MGFWRERRQFSLPGSNTPLSRCADADIGGAMPYSTPIEVSGVYLGVAVAHDLGVRFIAADPRVTDMNESIWPNFDYAKRSARQLFLSQRSFASG